MFLYLPSRPRVPPFPTTAHALTPPLLYSCSTPGVQYHLEDISLSFSYISKFACAEWSSKCHITRLFFTEQKTQNQMHQTDRATYKSIPSFMYWRFYCYTSKIVWFFGFYLSIFHTNLAFRFCTFLYFRQIQCGMSFVRSGDERKKRKVY